MRQRHHSSAIIVGGGILGTMHALEAHRRGWRVVQLEADPAPRSATVRNFGMIWVSGRAPGAELEAALRARERWETWASSIDGLGFRADGSLTVVTRADQLRVLEQVCARDDAGARGVELWEPDRVRAHSPRMQGEFVGAMWCERDALVEPAAVLPALRGHLGADPHRYRWLPGRVAVRIEPGSVLDQTGTSHTADVVIVCPGARSDGAVAELLRDAPVRAVRLQMAQTAPLGDRLATMLADEDSLHYYPAFDVPARSDLEPPSGLVAEHRMQLLVAQRADGSLTIGDTHQYDQPFPVGLHEAPYDHLMARLAELLGRTPPPLERRWAGIYSQCTDPTVLCWRGLPADGLVIVTGPGGRGMTLAPALAEQTLEAL